MRILFMLIIWGYSTAAYCQESPLFKEIRSLNKSMEEAFNRGDLKAVADFYLDEAVLLSPNNDPVTGRQDIDAYWTGMNNPVSWRLEVIEVSPTLDEIYENDYYRALEVKPPSWRTLDFASETDEQALVYELGRSTLTTMYQGKEHDSVVSFILVWKFTADGYRILVDTYSW